MACASNITVLHLVLSHSAMFNVEGVLGQQLHLIYLRLCGELGAGGSHL
jgi:hypothetical protein